MSGTLNIWFLTPFIVLEKSGDSVRRVLYDTAYHEAFHGAVEPIGKCVSRLFRVDDIYEASYENMLYNNGWGIWYRIEEGAAERYGRCRGYLRELGWKR